MPSDRVSIWASLGAAVLLLLAACRSRESSLPPSSINTRVVAPTPESAALAIEKQKHIWDIEHAAFELEQKFGRAFGAALRARDADMLQRFCRPGFEAALPSAEQFVSDDLDYVRQDRWHAIGAATSVVDAARFAEHLMAYFTQISEIDKVTCRVLDLHARSDKPETGHWDITLYLAAVGRDHEQAFVELVSEHQLHCYFLDDDAIESGTILDKWVVRSEVVRRSEQPLFEEVTKQYGLDQVDLHDNWTCSTPKVRQYHTQMAVEDFDRDGFYDLALASFNGRWRLLRSMGGKRFEEVTDQCGLPPWSVEDPWSRAVRDQAYLATWIDFNNDSYPDLVLGDRLYKNHQGRRFEDVTDTSGLVFGYNPRGCVVADYDCDGRLDLYVLYQHPRATKDDGAVGWVGDVEGGMENHLWRNVGDGRFVNSTDAANAGGGRRESFAASWFHANDDHFPDLYVANDFGTNALLINQGNGKFLDESEKAGVSDYATSMGVATGDITGDGRSEIYVANMFSKMGRRIIAHVASEDYPAGIFQQIRGSCAGNRLYTAKDTSPLYQEVSENYGVNTIGWAYAPVMADFDSDGQLDIYATTGFLSFQRGKPDG